MSPLPDQKFQRVHCRTPVMRDRLDRWLLSGVDICLASVLFITPLFMGGRSATGKFAFVVVVGVSIVLWSFRQCLFRKSQWRRSGVEWLLFAGLCLIGFQLIHLPSNCMETCAPVLTELLPLWSVADGSSVRLGTWNQLSLTPEETRHGLVMLLAYVLLFLVVVQRIVDLRDIERLLKWVAISVVVMAVLGLVQYLVGNGKFLWIYEHPFRTTESAAKGSFANQNHFAHFLALGLGPLLWWLWTGYSGPNRRQRRRLIEWNSVKSPGINLNWIIPFGVGVVGLAGLLTYSRGGVLVIFVAACLTVSIYVTRSIMHRGALLAIGATGVVVCTALAIHGYDALCAQLDTLRISSVEEFAEQLKRTRIWSANFAAFQDFPLFGTGVGSHRFVYPIYFPHASNVEFTHSESGYIQVLLETGLAGILLLVVGICYCIYWSFRTVYFSPSGRMTACAGALASSLTISLLHSIVDFVWYMTACMGLTVILVGCLCRLNQMFTSEEKNRSYRSWNFTRPVGVTIVAVVVTISSGMMYNLARPALAAMHWDGYRKVSRRDQDNGLFVPVESLVGADDANGSSFRLNTERMRAHLDKALAANPFDARSNARMAAICLRQFDIEQQSSANAMSLAFIRDAALASQFASKNELDLWLSKAIGDNRRYLDEALVHVRRAMQFCPLQGEAYIYLSELSFLESSSSENKNLCVEQALRVRPYQGMVLFAAGREAALNGNLPTALQHWKSAFHQGANQQRAIVQLLGSQVPVSFMLETFQPDRTGLSIMFAYYREQSDEASLQKVGRRLVVEVEQDARLGRGEDAARNWHSVHRIHHALDDRKSALVALQRSVQVTPNHIWRRYDLARYLVEVNRCDVAIEHLQWCLRRRPGEEAFTKTLRTALKKRSTSTNAGKAAAVQRDTTRS